MSTKLGNSFSFGFRVSLLSLLMKGEQKKGSLFGFCKGFQDYYEFRNPANNFE